MNLIIKNADCSFINDQKNQIVKNQTDSLRFITFL